MDRSRPLHVSAGFDFRPGSQDHFPMYCLRSQRPTTNVVPHGQLQKVRPHGHLVFDQLMISSINCAALVALSLVLPFSFAATTGRERRATTCNGFPQVCVSHALISQSRIYQVHSCVERVTEMSLLSVPTTPMQLGLAMVSLPIVWR
jgi:hypothetical protein